MLKVEHLYKKYKGTNKGVEDICLHIQKGDIYAFIGHNGSGKTTTLKCIAQIHDYDQGDILIDGISIKEDGMECKRRMAYIPDNPDLYDYLTGIQYLNFIGDIYEISEEERKERILKYSECFEIQEALNELISSYSHGMKQKLAIISALIHQPKLLVLDEPFVGLDPKATVRLKEMMVELCENGGAIFFSTHVLDVAERLCNKVAVIKDGKIVTSGTMESILKDGTTLENYFMGVISNE